MTEGIKKLNADPKLGAEVPYRNRANVLCNYMKELEYLQMILEKRAISPRYVIESLNYLHITGLEEIAFPMTCFCDMPLAKAADHVSRYGKYGIAFYKDAAVNKFRIQPIHYMNSDAPLADDFRHVFERYYTMEHRVNDEDRDLLNYLLSVMAYMKPIAEFETNQDGEQRMYTFQDECEWRYIPSDHFPSKELPMFLNQNQISDKACDVYSTALAQKHPETWLRFDWDDVKYLIVPDEQASLQLICVIKNLLIEEETKDLLISKIKISIQ